MEASVAVAAGNMDARSMRINTTSSTTSSSTTTASSVGHQHSRRNNNNHNNANASGMHISDSNILRSPYLSTLLEYTGIINRSISTSTSRPNNHSAADSNNINNQHNFASYYSHPQDHGPAGGEVSISIIEHDHSAPASSLNHSIPQPQNEDSFSRLSDSLLSSLESQQHLRDDFRTTDHRELPGTADTTDSASEGGDSFNHRDSSSSSYQRYDIQQAARWIEQVLPFTLLLLLVFVRQHLEGFCVTICIAGIMFKSNDIIRKQTALKAERIIFVLVGISVLLTLPVFWVYWWYSNDNLLYPLLMLPPKTIPPFWHAIFIIMVNDTLVRQAAMVIKCMVLIYYKNSKGRDYRRQGQMLTLVEYLLLLYRALLPAPVWYRFFLNKEYGSLFSSLMTGLYLTFKLTSVVEKVQSFITALKALSRKDIHYGAYATSEQVIAAGDLCAICQEKMHAPILLRCNHIFCEDCVSEWFERERTCPLCRAVVKPSDLKSYGDGSTNLFFQLF